VCCRKSIGPGQPPVDSWTNTLHRLWTKKRSTGCARSCPPTAHRLEPVVPSHPQLLHTPVHCSATRRARSPCRVKGVTPRCRIGLWGTRVKLGTDLGRSGPRLCIECAELFVVHRDPRLSTASAHRVSGQKSQADLRKRGYPRFPQALLLRPTRESLGIDSKTGLCTTRSRRLRCRSARLDPEGHRLSARCVRLVLGVLPATGLNDTESDDEGQQGESAGNRRRRQR
jgi:hypothetical protein